MLPSGLSKKVMRFASSIHPTRMRKSSHPPPPPNFHDPGRIVRCTNRNNDNPSRGLAKRVA